MGFHVFSRAAEEQSSASQLEEGAKAERSWFSLRASHAHPSAPTPQPDEVPDSPGLVVYPLLLFALYVAAGVQIAEKVLALEADAE